MRTQGQKESSVLTEVNCSLLFGTQTVSLTEGCELSRVDMLLSLLWLA